VILTRRVYFYLGMAMKCADMRWTEMPYIIALLVMPMHTSSNNSKDRRSRADCHPKQTRHLCRCVRPLAAPPASLAVSPIGPRGALGALTAVTPHPLLLPASTPPLLCRPRLSICILPCCSAKTPRSSRVLRRPPRGSTKVPYRGRRWCWGRSCPQNCPERTISLSPAPRAEFFFRLALAVNMPQSRAHARN